MWLILLKRFWPYLLALAALGALWAWHAEKVHQADHIGYARAQAERKAQDDKATAEHNAKIEALNHEHEAQLADLAKQRDDALAHPVVRTIRVPVASVCPAPVNAGVPVADPQPVDVVVDDPGYGVFRDWLVRYASASGNGS